MFSSLFVCLLATLRKNFQTHLHEIFRKVGNGPMNKWLNFGGELDHHLDSSLLGDTESGINRLHCTTLQCWVGIAIATTTSLRHRPLAEVCTVPVSLHCFRD